MRRSVLGGLVVAAITLALVVGDRAGGALGAVGGARTATARCPGGDGHRRNPANPLDLPTAQGANPLTGAKLFVEGPGYGMAASAIAKLLGRDPAGFGETSWERFSAELTSGSYAAQLDGSPGLAHQINLLSKIASQPETARFSVFTAGGGPGAILSQVQKFVCRVGRADPSAVPVIATYFLTHTGNCHTNVDGPASQAVFRRHVHELALGLGDHRFVMFAELDAVDTSPCLSRAGLAARLKELKYEVDTLAALPHGVVYLEGGASDANTARYAAGILNKVDVRRIRGFYVGDTHAAWTADEIKLGNAISRLTHGAHFIVNTSGNGNGPKLNPHPVSQGIEDLCNPPGRGLGHIPTTATGIRLVDAFEWTGTPGRSAGVCGVSKSPPGSFDLGLALGLAANANNRLGPRDPSQPY